ncbi:TRAP transporter substrate-binding protein [Marinihelvus fidelis]|uniref:TRAP transporter substrate-binding protein n=1 Tax=Marinihelvus fidelis TaxID=2613842 RepID=A0A5N0T3Q2_9GAMM|nr:TRAP transporter substrate-binding protein [Marinihelvus fidelis]KAA9129700.1 TRAP transporter substrate-binding protein [Marinihelvus fidelis]
MKRRAFIGGLGAAGGVALAGLPAQQALASLASDTKVGMSLPANLERNGAYVWVKVCTDHLRAGGMNVRVYPNSTIGGERERTIQAQLGLLEINVTGGDEIGRWSPIAAAGSRPFLVDSYDHMNRIIDDTDYLATITADLAAVDLVMVDFVYVASMVGLFTRGKPVRRIEDLRSLRLRVLSEADMNLLRAWQVRGVQVAWEEVAQALQTGIVDAYLNPPNVAPMFGHGSVLDYYTNLRMGPAMRVVVASKPWMDALSPAQRALVRQAFGAARAANRAWSEQMLEADHQALDKAGIEWIELDDDERATWLEASARIAPSHWETPAEAERYLRFVESTRPEGARP